MRHPTRLPSVLTAGIAAILICAAGTASAQTQQQQKQALLQQKKAAVADAKKASDAEKSAEASVGHAKKTLIDLNARIKAAQQEVDEAAKALKSAEDEIVDAQPADSEFGKIRDEFRAADKKYQDARTSLLENDVYKDRLAKARESDNADAVLTLKKEFDELPEIAGPQTKLQDVKEKYEPQRAKILAADSKWADADNDLKEKKKALEDLKHQYAEASALAAKARAAAKKAAAIAAAAAQKAAMAQQKPPKH
jgi:chromosome segregation ATPase